MTKGRWNYAVYTPEKVRKEMGSVLSNASTDSRWGGVPRRRRGLVGKRVPRLIRGNSEPRRIRKLPEITLGDEVIFGLLFKEWPRNTRKALGCAWCRVYRDVLRSMVSKTKHSRQTDARQ